MSDAVLCTLAKHHLGDHDERGTPARSACRKVIRYKPTPLAPAAVATLARDAVDRDLAHHVYDGEPFDPGAHAAAMAEAKEALRLPHEVAAEHNHEGFGESTFPLSCPLCVTLLASLTPPTSLGGLAGCDGHDHGSLTKCVPPCPAFASPPAPPGPTCSPDCACRTHPADRGCAGCHPDRYHDGEGYVPCAHHFAKPAPVRTAPEPSTQDLIGAVLGAYADVDIRKGKCIDAEDKWKRNIDARIEAEHALSLMLSALAKHVGAGKLVLVGGATFKAISPRKPRGGELAADALWRLEPVEVAK